jgi:hypothetical protein
MAYFPHSEYPLINTGGAMALMLSQQEKPEDNSNIIYKDYGES